MKTEINFKQGMCCPKCGNELKEEVIGVCAFEGCENEIKHVRGMTLGRPSKFCSPWHGNADRQKRFRQRMKQKKEALD